MDRPTDETTVLVVEDDAMVRGWIRLSLDGSEFRLVGEAASANEATELLPRRLPELLLIDFRLSDGAGTELVRALRLRGVAAPVVLMTAHYEPGFNEVAREVGAQGSVLKTGSSEELLKALRFVRDGRAAFDPRHPARDPGRAALSPREREVLRLVAEGLSDGEIAARLVVSPHTVHRHVANVRRKLGLHSRSAAAAHAARAGLI